MGGSQLTASASRPMRRQASMTVLFVTVFIDLIGFGLVLPLLPFFASHFGVSGFMVTMLSSVFSLMQFLFAPMWGRLSDRMGRRPVLLVSLGGSALSYLALGFCTNFWGILATRAMAGFFGANIAVASAYIADITPPEKRSEGMGLIGAAFGLGFVLGPGMGALIAHFAYNPHHPDQVYQVIGWSAALLCGLNCLAAGYHLPESKPQRQLRIMKPDDPIRPAQDWRHAFSNPMTASLLTLYFLLTFAFANFETLFALLIQAKFEFDVRQGNMFFLFIGLVSVTVQGGLIGRLVKAFGESRLILSGALLLSLCMILLPEAGSVSALLLLLAGIGLGQGLNRSTILGLISKNSTPQDQGARLGLAQSVGSLARIVAPLAGGWLFDHAGYRAPFVTSGIMLLIGLVATSKGFLFKATS